MFVIIKRGVGVGFVDLNILKLSVLITLWF